MHSRHGSRPDGFRCIAPPRASIPESADSLAHISLRHKGQCLKKAKREAPCSGKRRSRRFVRCRAARRDASPYPLAGTMAFTPTGLSTSARRYDFCDGLASSTRRRVATFRRSASKTCPASVQPIRRPHAIIFRPFRSSPKSSTMHFMRCHSRSIAIVPTCKESAPRPRSIPERRTCRRAVT